MTEMTPEEVLAIDCTGLTYAFAEGLESALDGVDLQLKKGDRCLVVGANGGMLGRQAVFFFLDHIPSLYDQSIRGVRKGQES